MSVLILLVLAGCGAGTNTTGGGNQQQGNITIEIGSDFPTTASDASSGKPAEDGVDYAVSQANASNFLPGYTFVHIAKDDVGPSGVHDSTVGQNNVNDLIGDARVAGIIGPLNSNVGQAEMPVANEAPIALISPSNTNDCMTQNTPAYECGGANSKVSSLRPTGKVTYFRTAAMDQYQGAALASYAYKTKGYKTVYVIDDTEAYGAGLATNFINFFKQYGGTVLGHDSIQSSASYESELTKIAAKKPDLIFFGGNDSTGGITIRQQMVHVSGLANTPFMLGDGAKTSALAKAIKPVGGGPVYASVPGTDPSQIPAAQTFQTNYVKKYGNTGAYSYGAYDDTEILLQAIKEVVTQKKATAPTSSGDSATAKTFRQAVIDAIQTIKYDGTTGPQSFDQNGDTTNKTVSIYTLGSNASAGDGWQFLAGVDPTKS
jgi:branched-chain amino acid transport system substrate-binding protein